MNPTVRKRLIGYLGPNIWLLIGGAVLAMCFAFLDALILRLLSPFAQAFSSNGTAAIRPQVFHDVQMIALQFILLQIPKGISGYGQFYCMAAATNRIATSIRNDIYEHLHKLSLSYFERNRIGDLMSRMTNDVGLIQNGTNSVVDAVQAPARVVFMIGYMFILSWKLSLVILVFVPAISWVIGKITRRMRSLTIILQMKLADVAAVMEETIAGVRIVKSFGMERYEIGRFLKVNIESLRAALMAARRNAAVGPVSEFSGALALAAIILVGGWLVTRSELSFGNFLVFGGCGFFVASAARQIGRLGVTYHQTMAGVERIFQVLDEQPDLADEADAIVLGDIEGLVEFRDVYFSYQTGEEVLSSVSFTMEPGKAVAVVGPSGAGKSTIANVIPRFYDVTGGAVLVDGHDVRKVTAESLRRHIGIVPQETILFSGTIRDNVAYGKPDATDAEIEQAARAANAHDFIMQFEDGYNTLIGERGVRLSGGERQRVSIARAILKDPRILILDEATSSLDVASERLVQEALEKLMQGRTTLIIAHRLSTITKADNIIVLGNGKIVEQGAFEELMSRGGPFAGLYQSQLSVHAARAIAAVGGFDETAVE